MPKLIDDSTLVILSRATVEDNAVFLTSGQLDRKQYLAVNEILENIGGKWNRKIKGHVFENDPTEALEHVLLTGEITQPKSYGYFPTPAELARHIVELADIRPEHKVLEPSAGQGAIADEIKDCASITCFELLPENAKVLLNKGYSVIEGDFLGRIPNPEFDRVCMNPPFERQADIDHVLHAWRFLKPGGRLVSIMSAGVTFRENRKTLEFRQRVERSGYFKANPPGSFKASGTMVNTVTVVMDR